MLDLGKVSVFCLCSNKQMWRVVICLYKQIRTEGVMYVDSVKKGIAHE
jgi:hypothetical protein